jgi:hypothetical protein
MTRRKRIQLLAGALIGIGTLALARPAIAAESQPARFCSISCGFNPGFKLCAAYCDDTGAYCEWTPVSENCPAT